MNPKRLELLKAYIEQDPNEPFNWYAMAMEYAQNDPVQAHKILQRLIRDFPDYLPAYYQCGVLTLQLNDPNEAQVVLEKGIALAKKNNDQKTLHELRSIIEMIHDESQN
jgi:tetratricopeptide (TPR) repeat protein